MKVCPECGAQALSDDDEFCVKCGANFPKTESIAPETGAPASATKVHVYSDEDPMKRGLALMSQDRFADAVNCWTEAVRAGQEIDSQTYERILEKSTETLLRIVVTPDIYNPARLWQLASLIDQDILTDLMARMMASTGVCTTKSGVLGLANVCMFLFVDCFNVYTDLRDLSEICNRTKDNIARLADLMEPLPEADPSKTGKADAVIGMHEVFVGMLTDSVAKMMDELGEEGMDERSDYWSQQASLPYASMLTTTFMINSQMAVVGRLGSKLLTRTRDAQIQVFSKSYMTGGKS